MHLLYILILIFNTRWNMSGMPMDDGLAVEKYAKSMIGLQKKNPVVYKEVWKWTWTSKRNVFLKQNLSSLQWYF